MKPPVPRSTLNPAGGTRFAAMTFQVDFNDVEGPDGRTLEVVATTDSPPAIGESVLLLDVEGNHCWAEVDDLNGSLVSMKLDLDRRRWRLAPYAEHISGKKLLQVESGPPLGLAETVEVVEDRR